MGRRPSFDRSSVLHAGLDLADEHGLAAVTMEAVARRIGVTPMALYRQVAGKADLLDGLVEMLLTEVPTPAVGSRGFAAALTEMADGLREVAHRHPGVFPLLLQRPATTPAAQQAREAVYVALVAAGVPPERVAASPIIPGRASTTTSPGSRTSSPASSAPRPAPAVERQDRSAKTGAPRPERRGRGYDCGRSAIETASVPGGTICGGEPPTVAV
jgi:AcrR family transcriptional regulator